MTDQELANLHQGYRHSLTRGVKELPPITERPCGKRGRLAKSAAHNLWDQLKKYEAAVVLLFHEFLISLSVIIVLNGIRGCPR
ncbi:hypothetical protein CMK14_09040 [Candidatus Poribacteria bacterium]|nr:hypothetical protein [Candidatus Poribacteria bacterium]